MGFGLIPRMDRNERNWKRRWRERRGGGDAIRDLGEKKKMKERREEEGEEAGEERREGGGGGGKRWKETLPPLASLRGSQSFKLIIAV